MAQGGDSDRSEGRLNGHGTWRRAALCERRVTYHSLLGQTECVLASSDAKSAGSGHIITHVVYHAGLAQHGARPVNISASSDRTANAITHGGTMNRIVHIAL